MNPIGYVVHVKTPGTQGGETRSYQMAQALSEAGTEVHLYGDVDLAFEWMPGVRPHVLSNPAPLGYWQLTRDFAAHGVNVAIQRYQFPLFNIGYFAQRTRRRPTVLEVHGMPIDEYTFLRRRTTMTMTLKRRKVGRLGSWLHEEATQRVVSLIPRPLALALQRKIFQHVAHFIVTSQGTKTILVDQGVSPYRITVIYNCVDPILFNPRRRNREIVRRQFGLPGQRQIVLYAGSLFHRELEIILQASKLVLARRPSAHILFVGKGTKGTLRKQAQEIGLSDSDFSILPAISHHKMPDLFAASDVVLAGYSLQSPRFRHAFHYSPLKVMEALAMEKAIVTVDAEELRRVFGCLPSVLFVKSGCALSWAEGIVASLDRANAPDLRQGRAFVLEGRDWHDAARQYLEVIEMVESSV